MGRIKRGATKREGRLKRRCALKAAALTPCLPEWSFTALYSFARSSKSSNCRTDLLEITREHLPRIVRFGVQGKVMLSRHYAIDRLKQVDCNEEHRRKLEAHFVVYRGITEMTKY